MSRGAGFALPVVGLMAWAARVLIETPDEKSTDYCLAGPEEN